MWFTNKVHSSSHYIKIKGLEKASKEHYFELDGGKIEETAFVWKLVKIAPSEYEFEGQMRQTIKILLVDDTAENYQLDISYNWLSRWLLNTLLWYIDNIKRQGFNNWKINLELSLYLNKDWYKQLWIRVNNERSNWRFDIAKQKEMIETITNKKGEFVSNDYSAYDEILKNWINEIQDFITVNDFIITKEEVTETKNNINWYDTISIEDIPF